MLRNRWSSYTITSRSQFTKVKELVDRYQPRHGGFDTETTGLNIKLDKPFVFTCGFLASHVKEGVTFAVDLEQYPDLGRAFIKFWHTEIARLFEKYMAHNIKFDLHMLENFGTSYLEPNVTDTMFYIRHAHDHIPERFGGVPLGLKPYATMYISKDAAAYEKTVKKDLGNVAKMYNQMLMQRLKNCGEPPAKYGARTYTMSVIEEMFSDCIFEIEDLPEAIRQEYLDWFTLDLPLYLQKKVHGIVETDNVPYTKADRKRLIEYAHWDIIFMLEAFDNLSVIAANRDTLNAIEAEEALIYPFFRMESTGFKINVPYLIDCKNKIRQYIRQQRERLYAIGGREFKVNQHALIKEILNQDFNLAVESTGDEELSLLHSKLLLIRNDTGEYADAVEFIEILQELRTLEKWYSTYIIRFLDNLKETDHLYTSINQVGAVSCRVTSDFQQVPKKGIKDRDGNELFHPRKLILIEGNGYDKTYCIDYSQIELRIQAFYTILVGDPDLNMCRAYMPYKCVDLHGVPFNFKDPTHLANWDGEWYYEEDTLKRWIPTDLHGVTTMTALGITPDHPDWKLLRSEVGKRVNFAENYGAQWGRIRIMFPDKTDEEITRIYNAYGTAYPGVKTYHQYCYNRAQAFSYTTNLFGVKYYNTSGHKLINLLVQGSAASLLKWKIVQIDKYIQDNHLKSRIQMQIHDELMFICYNGEEQHFEKIKCIMEFWPDTYVPIVAEAAVFTTNWAEKKGVEQFAA